MYITGWVRLLRRYAPTLGCGVSYLPGAARWRAPHRLGSGVGHWPHLRARRPVPKL